MRKSLGANQQLAEAQQTAATTASEETRRKASVGVAAVARRGSDRVSAEASAVLADGNQRHYASQIDLIEISSPTRHSSCYQIG